uniref:Uncharacterized protein n=1 Tax=Anguilla anguilla TaxID=7936 RepID=A0A0E9V653_ANGAN
MSLIFQNRVSQNLSEARPIWEKPTTPPKPRKS